MALKSDGTVWGWGFNYYGAIGDGTTINRRVPTLVAGLTNVVQIAGNELHSMALKSDGTVWTWGWNYYGMLGDGTTTQRNSPVLVAGLDHVTQISAGGYHSLAVKNDGTLWSWGANSTGQLGDGTMTQRNTPVNVPGITVLQVSGGITHTLAVQSDGSIAAWGSNASGILGDGTFTGHTSPITLAGTSNITQVSAGDQNSMALQSDGTVLVWGANYNGQLGDGTFTGRNFPAPVPGLTNQSQISMGWFHAMSVQAAQEATEVLTPNFTNEYAHAFLMKAQLRTVRSHTPIAGRSLTYIIDSRIEGVAVTDATGRIAIPHPTPFTITAGTHSVTVKFYGDSRYLESAGAATITVNKARTRLRMSNYTGGIGATRNLTATLSRLSDSALLSGKEVAFYLEGSYIGSTITDATGRAVLPYIIDNTFGFGVKTLTVKFYGDDNHLASFVTPTLTITQAATRLVLSNVAGRVGTNVNLKARLNRRTDNMVLAGKTVRFEVDGAAVGSAVTDASGFAMLPINLIGMAVGGHTVAAYFDGDVDYLSTSVSAVALTVLPLMWTH